MSNDLGTLEVGFEINPGNLTSGFDNIKSQVTNVGDAIMSSNDMMLASYDELASGVGSAMSSIVDDSISAAGGLDEMAAQGGAAGSDLVGVLGEINDSILMVRDVLITMSGESADAMASLEESVGGVKTAVEDMSSSVTTSIEDIDTQFTTLGEEATVAGEDIAAAGEHASSGGGWMNLFNQIGIGIFNIQNMINIAGQLTSALLGPAMSAEEVASSLEIFTGSAAKAKKELEDLASFAAHTPFETQAIDDAALKMQSVGINAKNVIPYIQALGDALDATGRISSADLNQIVDNFDKIQTTGHLTTDVMNSFALAGIDAWSVLEKQTGMTHAQLAKLISAGLYPADKAMKDLTAGIEASPIYKGQMANDANLITGAISTLKSNWDQILAAFGDPIIKGLEPIINNLSASISSPAFKDFAGSVGQGVVDVFKSIGDAGVYIGNVLHSLNLTGLNQAWHDLTTAVQPLIADFQHLGNVLNPIQGDFDPLAEAIANIGKSGLSTLTGFIEGLAHALQGLGQGGGGASFLNSLAAGFKSVQSIVGGSLNDDFKFFQQTVRDLSKWWQSDMAPAIKAAEPGFEHLGSVLATTVAPAFAKLWSVGQQLAREVIGPATKEFETMEPVLVRVGGFLADNLGTAIQNITPDIVSASQAVAQFVGDIETRAEPIVEALSTALHGFLDWIGPYWPSIWGAISAVFTATWDTIKGTFQIAWSIFSGSWKVLLDILTGNWKKAWDDIKGIFSGVWDGIKTIAGGVWGVIQADFRLGLNFVIDMINNFIRSIDSIGIDVGPVHIHPSIPTIPRMAAGGIVPPGGVAIAGDPGPNEELVLGGTSGATVLSNAQSSRLLAQSVAASGGRTAQEIHIHVYLDGMEITDLVGNRLVQSWLSHGPVKTLRSA